MSGLEVRLDEPARRLAAAAYLHADLVWWLGQWALPPDEREPALLRLSAAVTVALHGELEHLGEVEAYIVEDRRVRSADDQGGAR